LYEAVDPKPQGGSERVVSFPTGELVALGPASSCWPAGFGEAVACGTPVIAYNRGARRRAAARVLCRVPGGGGL